MKITKENLKLFRRLIVEMQQDLNKHLLAYTAVYIEGLREMDAKAIDLNSVQELTILAKQATQRGVELFLERGNSGDDIVREAQRIIDGK